MATTAQDATPIATLQFLPHSSPLASITLVDVVTSGAAGEALAGGVPAVPWKNYGHEQQVALPCHCAMDVTCLLI